MLTACSAFNLTLLNQRNSEPPMATVYQLEGWVMDQMLGLEELALEQFAGMTWTNESLMYFLARRGKKQILNVLTFPHRCTTNVACFLDKSLPQLVEEKDR